eukprot:COSAG02_NODE_908_length_16032_cov_53.699931_7_plen_57_part_00
MRARALARRLWPAALLQQNTIPTLQLRLAVGCDVSHTNASRCALCWTRDASENKWP